MLLTKILKQNAKKYPNKPAFTMKMGYRTVHLTYKDVYTLSKKIALFLESQGCKKGDKILLFAPNSPYWCCVFWGTILKGYVIVPLNVQSTSEMIKTIADQTESKIIIKSHYLNRQLPKQLKCFDIEFIDDLVKDFRVSNFRDEKLNKNNLVEILYTSGTTGDPKGVMLTHKNIASNIEAGSSLFPMKKLEAKGLSILPLTHIYEQTVGFLLPSKYVSHIIYVHSYALIQSLAYEHKINLMLTVPEFLKVLLSKIEANVEKQKKTKVFNAMLKLSAFVNNKSFSRFLFRSVHKKLGGKLDTVICGGAPLDEKLEKKWQTLGVTLLQGYGLTETSPVIAGNRYKHHKFGSVGKILKGFDVKIEKDGEILVKGPCVFKGYFKNEKRTKEAFTEDGYFKTGDVGHLDKDGFLFLSGRKKYVIIGPSAQNIFPEDIEIEINKNEHVKDSCVVGLETKSGMIEIHAVLLLKDKKMDSENIILQTNKQLASYQQATGWSVWPDDDFPRSATKKVKKEEVLKFLKSRKENNQKENHVAKTTALSKILSQITGFDIEKIKPTTKILPDLKLDSLTLVELILRVETDLGVAVNETMITPTTTMLELETIIKKKAPAKPQPPLKKWPRSWWAHTIRFICQPVLIAYFRIFARLKVSGKKNLKNLDLPVIFMPTHMSYMDPLALVMALPLKVRNRLAFAAARDVLYKSYKDIAWIAELLMNSFSLPRKEGENIRLGLDHMGKLLDNNYSIGVFPEGKMSLDGKLQPLKQGVGLMAIEMNVAVVPVKLVGTNKVLPYEKIFPKHFDKVTVKFGKPLKFKKSDSYDFAIEKIYKALDKL
jgi:long-chain acyl-CoA synthetase